MEIQIDKNVSISLMPDKRHEYLMSTNEVALGYGVKPETIRSHKNNHKAEILENVHFTSVENFNAGRKTCSIYYTKLGVIKMGFFVKSNRAVAFREWASKVILQEMDQTQSTSKIKLPKSTPAKHIRITKELLLEMALDFHQIPDEQLRHHLVEKYIRKYINI